MSTPTNKRIAVIGAGAAGLFAAGTAARLGADVTVYEHREKPGRKLLITGKGRCNVTNNCSPQDFLEHVVRNPRFLYSAISSLPPAKLMSLLEEYGVELKTERGRRVFPASDRSSDILAALLRFAEKARRVHAHVSSLLVKDGSVCGLVAEGTEVLFDEVILATGGLSYPATGSDGSGYALALGTGHTIEEPIASLVALTSEDPCCALMQGLSLKNTSIRVADPDGKTVYEDFGEMLFAHFGVSGPMILSASAYIPGKDARGYRLSIDLKPALDEQTLDRRILSDFAKSINRDLCNALDDLLPQKMIPAVIEKADIDPRKKVNAVTREERMRICRTIKNFSVVISGRRPIEEAIVTRGGVNVAEVSPKTMASKVCEHLYFAGEILDVDACTGGYNLQIAFSTGYLAAQAAVESKR